MKIIKKNVYYCDYCNKRNLSASHMKNHELTCTANPNRECHLCGQPRGIKSFVEKLKTRFEIKDCEAEEFMGHTLEIEWKGDIIILDEILDFTEGCPNCTLAILRQTKLNYEIFGFKYNYKGELSTWWSEKNNEQYQEDLYDTYRY